MTIIIRPQALSLIVKRQGYKPCTLQQGSGIRLLLMIGTLILHNQSESFLRTWLTKNPTEVRFSETQYWPP